MDEQVAPAVGAGGAPTATRFRVAELALFPAGHGTVLVHTRDGGRTRLLPTGTVDLLLHCQQFRTIDEHVRRYCRGRQVTRATPHTMQSELDSLSRDGFLVAHPSAVGMLATPGAADGVLSIRCIAVPTCDRVDLLSRNLAGLVESCRRFERSVEVVVADDTADPDGRAACRAILRSLSDESGVCIAYAGAEEKRAFADMITDAGDVPSEIVHFACTGDTSLGLTTVGANRNAVLLHTVGEMIFSVDDDVACRIAAAPDRQDGIAFSSQGSPLEASFFPDRESALRSVDFVQRDVLALHEQWLGRDPWAVAGANHSPEIHLDEADPTLLRRLRAGQGRVAVTLNGTVGDCAWDNADFYLFQRDETVARLTRSENSYHTGRSTRELVQAARRTTFTDNPDPMFATCIGLDNRRLLPPFTPVGRAEDVAFGVLLARCCGPVYAVHLPWVLVHAPAGARSFPDERMFSVSFNSWIPSCISRLDPGLGHVPAERLRKVGADLQEIGRLPGTAFDEFVRQHMWENMSTVVTGLEERIQAGAPPPAYWLRGARAFIERARNSALVPVEELYQLPGGRRTMQHLLVRYGQTLAYWPGIVDAARRLRSSGIRLAQPA